MRIRLPLTDRFHVDTSGAALQSTPLTGASEDGQNPQAKQALRVAQTTVDSLKVS